MSALLKMHAASGPATAMVAIADELAAVNRRTVVGECGTRLLTMLGLTRVMSRATGSTKTPLAATNDLQIQA